MRIPKHIPLESYIRKLIKEDRIIEFYKSDDWLELRADVLEAFHNECQECLKRGKVTHAECVHHVNEVRKKPQLALSRYYTDRHGEEQFNLVPLCNACHNMQHPEKGWGAKKNDRFTNKERW